MKKLICVLMTIVVLISCCACGKGQETAAPTLDPSSIEGMYGHIDQTQPIDGVYKIWNSEGVKNMANHPDGNFELLCDVDMQGATLQPIGTDAKPFTGTIEGTNHNILNFTVQGGEDANFGFVAVNKGTIQNIRFQNVTLLPGSKVKNAGAFAGDNQGTISRCYMSGTMTIETAAEGGAFGGLVGKNSGKLANTTSMVDLVVNAPAAANVGGIVGITSGGTVQYVDMEGKLTVTGNKTVGLFAGTATDTVFTNCAFLGADNSLDGKLFTNFTGNADDDELAVAVEGRWRDNDIEPMPENVAALRDKVVNTMYAMGSIEWHVDKELVHDCKCSQSACIGVYTPDYTYVGMPYKHGNGNFTSFTGYFLDENNYVQDWVWDMDARFGYDSYMGTMCTSAVETALWTVCNSIDAPIPQAFYPVYYPQNNCIPVGTGWWEEAVNYNQGTAYTDVWVLNRTEQQYFEDMALVRRGDILNQGIEPGVHTIMVATDPVIVRDQQGLIDGDRSYLTTHEQCGGAAIDDEKMTWTTWRLHKKQTFTALRNKWWIATTIEEFVTGEMETPECKIIDGAEGRLGLTTGIIKGNYFMERVTLNITDSKGNVVVNHYFFPKASKFDDANQRLTGLAYVDSYDLANFSMFLQNVMFEPGETYEYTISAHLATGDEFLVKTDSFTQGGTK